MGRRSGPGSYSFGPDLGQFELSEQALFGGDEEDEKMKGLTAQQRIALEEKQAENEKDLMHLCTRKSTAGKRPLLMDLSVAKCHIRDRGIKPLVTFVMVV